MLCFSDLNPFSVDPEHNPPLLWCFVQGIDTSKVDVLLIVEFYLHLNRVTICPSYTSSTILALRMALLYTQRPGKISIHTSRPFPRVEEVRQDLDGKLC